MNVLVLNAGSSSLRFQLIATDLGRIAQDNDEHLCRGQIERIGEEAIIAVRTRNGLGLKFTASLSDILGSLEYLVRWIASDESGITEVRPPSDIHAVGHRVVHGGEVSTESTVITEEVLQGIEECIDLAPLHNPNNLKGILDALLNTQSGLLGISGLTNDMRVLLKELSDQDVRRVRLAIEVFCYRARKYVGAFLACMGGADAIVFTGGIGENSPDIRARICEGLEWTGLRLDDNKNKQMVGLEGQISSDDSSLRAFVIPTDEELLIARDTVRCILGEPGEHRVAAAENSGVGEMTH